MFAMKQSNWNLQARNFDMDWKKILIHQRSFAHTKKCFSYGWKPLQNIAAIEKTKYLVFHHRKN